MVYVSVVYATRNTSRGLYMLFLITISIPENSTQLVRREYFGVSVPHFTRLTGGGEWASVKAN